MLTAAGGKACSLTRQIAPNNVTSVVIRNGDSYGSTGEALTLGVHWHESADYMSPNNRITTQDFPAEYYSTESPTGCYQWYGSGNHHKHNKTPGVGNCPKHRCGKPCSDKGIISGTTHRIECSDGHLDTTGESHDGIRTTCDIIVYTCGFPANTWTKTCTKYHGEIDTGSRSDGTCYNPGSVASASLSNTGAARCTIQLSERSGIQKDSVPVALGGLYYADAPVYLVLKDNTVCYFKRKP